MELTTSVKALAGPTLKSDSSFLCLGSCFAERVGLQLRRSLWNTVANPCGVYYNPVSLAAQLKSESEFDLFLHDSLWRSLSHHSLCSRASVKETRELLSQSEARRMKALRESNTLLLTLGTAQVFVHRNFNRVVANCHRLPQSLFCKRRLSVEESVQALYEPLRAWLEKAPDRQVIISVSPVRYTREGLTQNSRSKATLLLTCEELEARLSGVHYFPAFEIMMDELRDYRFYQESMLQPNSVAVSIIWSRFQDSFFDNNDKRRVAETARLWKLAEHRTENKKSSQKIRSKLLSSLQTLKTQFPTIQDDYFRDTLASSESATIPD